jgi:hypothetical protein
MGTVGSLNFSVKIYLYCLDAFVGEEEWNCFLAWRWGFLAWSLMVRREMNELIAGSRSEASATGCMDENAKKSFEYIKDSSKRNV